MARKYWEKHPESPFAMLFEVSDTYCHPEADAELYAELQELAQWSEPPEWLQTFGQQLREALRDPSQLPKGALGEASQHGDGSDEAFLDRLWRDLYGDEEP